MRNVFTFLLFCSFQLSAGHPENDPKKIEAAEKRLQSHIKLWRHNKKNSIGYPINQEPRLTEFYEWYVKNSIMNISMNNVGDPDKDSYVDLNTHDLELEVIAYFAPRYGFTKNNFWGFVSGSGTDGNNHGLYFGRKFLQSRTDIPPIAYVSKDAHYSIKKLADVQNIELKVIETNDMGQMDIVDFEKQLVVNRPAIITVALGTTFKGAIDDQVAIRNILKKKNVSNFYIHLDAALFGGYLPYSKDVDAQNLVRQDKMGFHSIAVSGHKFFGFDNPLGLFVTTNEVYENINPFRVEYLGGGVPTISCSRSALEPLKFWWKINTSQDGVFETQSESILQMARYLKEKLDAAGYKAWLNPHSNTVFFERPKSAAFIDTYDLAIEKSEKFGLLAHVVVMQHVDKEKIDQFVTEWQKSDLPS